MAARDLQNTERQLNQIQTIGNLNPPNMANIPSALLKAASPSGFDLSLNTKTDAQTSGRARLDCTKYQGLDGLRRLQVDQNDQTYYEPACGWMYNGVEVNRAASGTFQGPNDRLPSGAKWYFGRQELAEAEKAVDRQRSLDELKKCRSPLSRDCVLQAARTAGCKDNGTMIMALQGGSSTNYGSKLRESPAFTAYQQLANPNITNAIFADGSTSVENALADFDRLMKNIQSPNTRLSSAARELCIGKQEGFRSYMVEPFQEFNFCADIKPTDPITRETIVCAQQIFKDPNGIHGSDKGTAYPRRPGGTFGQLNQTIAEIKRLIASPIKEENARGIQMLRGDDSFIKSVTLPRESATRGAEMIWITYPDMANGTIPPIIIRADRLQTEFGAETPIPVLRQTSDFTRLGVPTTLISFVSLFEVRPDNDTTLQVQVNTDDGFMLGYNKIPISGSSENTWGENTWGSWRYQGDTRYVSQDYRLSGEQKNKTNMFMIKWFQGGGPGTFDLQMNLDKRGFKTVRDSASLKQSIYFVQEPLAPWLQFELCSRDNSGKGDQLGFHDKRIAGSTALTWSNRQQIYPMGTVTKDVGFIRSSDMGLPNSVQGYVDFKTASTWHTNAYFNFTAFKTITLLVKPMANLSPNSRASIFQLINFANTFGTGLYLATDNQGNYSIEHWFGSRTERIPVLINEWNMIVLQFIGTDTTVSNVRCSIAPYAPLRNSSPAKAFFREINGKQGVGGAPVYQSAMQDQRFSGYLVLGGSGGQGFTDYKDAEGLNSWKDISFTGQVAWIHGFTHFLDTEELLRKEIEQTWSSRWPIV